MRKLLQPIPEALAILQRDNPSLRFEMPSEHGIYMQSKPGGEWKVIVSQGADGVVRVFEHGENTLSMDDTMYQFVYHGGPEPKQKGQ